MPFLKVFCLCLVIITLKAKIAMYYQGSLYVGPISSAAVNKLVTRLSHQHLFLFISKFATIAYILQNFRNNYQEQYLDYST